jgi:ribosome maturation factor RimP
MTKAKEMMEKEIVDRVRAMAEPILLDERMELVDIEYRRESKGWVLRLTLDKEGGITLDDCTRISQEVGRNLDVEDFIQAPYALEVSSPGLTRRLKTEKDFMKYLDSLIKVKTVDPLENRRQFKGRLLKVSENHIEMEVDGEIFQISLSNVAKAHLEVDWEALRKETSKKDTISRKLR